LLCGFGRHGTRICPRVGSKMQLVHMVSARAIAAGSAVLRINFELKLVPGTAISILIGLLLYWRGARTQQGA